jgi:hypothetical protein
MQVRAKDMIEAPLGILENLENFGSLSDAAVLGNTFNRIRIKATASEFQFAVTGETKHSFKFVGVNTRIPSELFCAVMALLQFRPSHLKRDEV